MLSFFAKNKMMFMLGTSSVDEESTKVPSCLVLVNSMKFFHMMLYMHALAAVA